MAGSTLGPFPKTVRWAALCAERGESHDQLLEELRSEYEVMARDEAALRATTFMVSLAVCTRFPRPLASMRELYGIQTSGSGQSAADLVEALRLFAGDGEAARAASATIIQHAAIHAEKARLFDLDPWAVWRAADGPGFCDLARLYFANLNETVFSRKLGIEPGNVHVRQFAHETSLITRAFSARWFNACAREEPPELGSIRWYLGHCLGKLDLELERERSDWVEPKGKRWSRRRVAEHQRLAL